MALAQIEESQKEGSGVIVISQNPSPVEEERDLEADHEKLRKKLSNQQYAQDIRERRKYALYAYKITKNWACALICVVIFQMILSICDKGLSDASFIAVITTTTTSMFGFWWLVGKYLFNGQDP